MFSSFLTHNPVTATVLSTRVCLRIRCAWGVHDVCCIDVYYE